MAGGDVLQFEQAKTGRSTCRATNQPIEKGVWRVGFECWIGQRMAVVWMLPLPFLQDCCTVEYCASRGGSQGSCRATGRKFEKGDVRFRLTGGDEAKKIYLSLPAAGVALAPVLKHVGADWAPTRFAGLDALAADDRAAFYAAFSVGAAAAAAFDAAHPPPPRPDFGPAKKPAAKKRSGSPVPATPAKAAKGKAAQGTRKSRRTAAAGEEEEEGDE